jgi:hypothetical protein
MDDVTHSLPIVVPIGPGDGAWHGPFEHVADIAPRP